MILANATTLKRQKNCLNQALSTKSTQISVTTDEDCELEEASTTEPSSTSNTSSSLPNKGIHTEHKSKMFCHNSSSSASSTYSNSSTTSSKASSRTDSNEKPTGPHGNTHNQISRHHLASNGLNPKYSTSSSSGSSTTSTNGSPSSHTAASTTTNHGGATKAPTAWNIENELIRYTKNLKLNNRLYTDIYKLGAHIRNGGFSEIYEGYHHLRKDQKVVIKLIPKRKTKNWLMVSLINLV